MDRDPSEFAVAFRFEAWFVLIGLAFVDSRGRVVDTAIDSGELNCQA